MIAPVVHLVVGGERHGVVRHGVLVAEGGDGRLVRIPDPTTEAPEVTAADLVVHFTDRLFGGNGRQAAVAFEGAVGSARRVTVVLHDLPQASDGGSWAARQDGYARVARFADGVVVSSAHEAKLLAVIAPEVRAHIVPLPVARAESVAPERAWAEGAGEPGEPGRHTVGVLGFLYPGKGVEEVLAASAGLGVRVVNLGMAAPGHESLVGELTGRAAALGIPFEVTGWLSEAGLLAACRRVTVPVAAHQHVSASGSINAWLAAGRRPIVAESVYAREQLDRMPGSVWIAPPERLAASLQRALRDPGSTWLADSVILGPSAGEVARRLEAIAGAR